LSILLRRSQMADVCKAVNGEAGCIGGKGSILDPAVRSLGSICACWA
jgi:hypothetical protein